jgi:hypothetical protein
LKGTLLAMCEFSATAVTKCLEHTVVAGHRRTLGIGEEQGLVAAMALSLQGVMNMTYGQADIVEQKRTQQVMVRMWG